jgi:hypothetical protein
MKAVSILADLSRQGFCLEVCSDGGIHIAPKDRVTDAIRQLIKENKADLVPLLPKSRPMAKEAAVGMSTAQPPPAAAPAPIISAPPTATVPKKIRRVRIKKPAPRDPCLCGGRAGAHERHCKEFHYSTTAMMCDRCAGPIPPDDDLYCAQLGNCLCQSCREKHARDWSPVAMAARVRAGLA